ncbi:MAG: protein BatD [Calditrichaeota bacterium]|nr:protein BatD [Calditrichota bacterium]
MKKIASALSIIFLLLLFMAFFNFSAQAQDSTAATVSSEIRITSTVDRKQVPLNRTLKLTVRVEWSGDVSRYQISELEDPILNNLEIYSTSSADFRTSEGGVAKAARTYEFILKPKTLGMAYIEGVIVKYIDSTTGEGHSLTTNRINVEVVESEPEPNSGRGLLFWLLAVALPIVVGGGVASFVKKKLEKRKRKQFYVPVKSLEEEFLETLHQSLSADTVAPNLNQGYYVLSKITRRYLKRKYRIDALELTTDEILKSLSKRDDVEKNMVDMIDEVLRTCDLAKFSGSQGDVSEYQRLYTLFESIRLNPFWKKITCKMAIAKRGNRDFFAFQRHRSPEKKMGI